MQDKVQNLRKHRGTLATQLRRTEQIADVMFGENHVTQQQLETLQLPQLTMYERAERLIDLLITSNSEQMYESFLDALSSTHQWYLLELLERHDSGLLNLRSMMTVGFYYVLSSYCVIGHMFLNYLRGWLFIVIVLSCVFSCFCSVVH